MISTSCVNLILLQLLSVSLRIGTHINFKREIEIKKIEIPGDIVSSEKDNCLYVSALTGKCIWKITRETTGQHKIVKWLTIDDFEQSTLSLSSDGQSLVVNSKSSVLM